MSSTGGTDPLVAVASHGACLSVMLQRPKALNALNLQMIRELWAAYERAGADASVRCLLLEGAGGKAFCAGGDVKGVWQEAQTDAETSSIFFREEYALNAAIAGCPKPQVSVWDGIVMGGGVGLSVHGAYRVATERTMFAMPETNIGLFPDVGGSHFLAAMPGELGTYIGLTGHRLGAADLLYSGLATHYIPSAAVTELPAALGACASAADVEAALTELGGPDAPSSSVGGGVLEQQRSLIDEAFAHDTIEAILAHLVSIQGDATRHADAVDFATATLGTLGRMSPTSMKITLRLVREARADAGAAAPLTACLEREFRVVRRCITLGQSDFFEGIRAALVDKDRNPQWSPAAAEGVSDAKVAEFFASLGERELEIPLLPGFEAP